ncbi:DUF3592 domain-containing protein [Gilvimarinus agarilyticus]|uniref:DUF3592 domain-containing protein n=1 Tax=Gilvimarinus agarilyticus TaxID=679259 RepID=UPI0009FD5717|nr:DUF3592 domain-containing protein [Gilvimarinus agarilyticus]
MTQGETYVQANIKASGSVWKRIKKRWLGMLFGLPFAAVGIGMALFGVLPQFIDWQQMKQWQAVPAQLSRAELKVSHGDDSTTYKATASYRYEYQGLSYSGERVSIDDSFDNIGDFNYALGRRLERAAASNSPVTAYVNPAEPSSAVLNRDLRPEKIGFKMIFVVLFGGVGIGIIAYLLLAPVDEIEGAVAGDKPWLTRRRWASATIKSSGKTIMIFAWCFAAFWNAIAIPTGINCIVEFLDGNTVALVGLLFPLVGAGMVFWAVKETAKWRRFGPAPLQLDPYPGAIGGQFGGTIDVNLPYDPAHAFKVTLQCLESYYTGSGKDRKRRENCVWQREGYAHTQRSSHGTLLELLFDVAAGLPESEPEANRYHLWRLNVEAELPGVDFDRSYEVPVFATGASAAEVRNASEQHEQALQERERLLDSALDIQQIPGGIAMHYPAFKSASAKVVGIIFGAVSFTAGYFIDAAFMGPLFMGIGAVVVLPCLYFLLTSLDVTFNRQQLITQRKLFGITLTSTRVARSELTHLGIAESYSSQSGNNHATYYKVQAHRRHGRAVTIGYSFKSEAVAKQALESISLLTGVPEA